VYDSAARQARRRLTRTWWALPALVAVVFVLLQGLAGPRVAMNGDSEQYGRISLQLSGVPEATARREAWRAWCDAQAADAAHTAGLDPLHFREPSPAAQARADCLRTFPRHRTAASRRYEAIFDARIGYPLLAIPAVRLLGVRLGLWATSVVLTGLGGFLVAWLLTLARAGVWGAVAGELVFLLGPLGGWGVHPLAEGALNTAVVLTLLGAWWLLTAADRSAVLRGAVAWLAGLTAASAVKYSSGVLLAACLALAAVLAWITVREARHRGTLLLAGGSTLAAVAVAALTAAAGAPGSAETLQDTFTRHFHRRDVPDPWSLLARLDLRYWADWLHSQAASPALLVLGALALWLLFRRRPLLGWPAAAAALVGMLTVAAHPLVYEAQRLGALEWLPAALGLPFLLAPSEAPRPVVEADPKIPREALNRSA
jgi:hypothetical protein